MFTSSAHLTDKSLRGVRRVIIDDSPKILLDRHLTKLIDKIRTDIFGPLFSGTVVRKAFQNAPSRESETYKRMERRRKERQKTYQQQFDLITFTILLSKFFARKERCSVIRMKHFIKALKTIKSPSIKTVRKWCIRKHLIKQGITQTYPTEILTLVQIIIS